MSLIDKKTLLLPAAAIFCTALTAPVASAAVSPAPQAAASPAADAAGFLGTWHWIVQGKLVVTMKLAASGPGFTGTMTAIQGIQLDKDNNVTRIEGSNGTISLLNAHLEGSVLHFETKDVDDTVQWTMTLKPDGTAEVEPSASGARAVKPIAAEKAK